MNAGQLWMKRVDSSFLRTGIEVSGFAFLVWSGLCGMSGGICELFLSEVSQDHRQGRSS